MLVIYIDCVNSDFYSFGSAEDDKARILKFLEEHDHEGSSIQLDIEGVKEILNNEEIYKYLKEQ